MLPETLKDWASLIAVLLSLGAIVHSWLTSRVKVNSEHLKAVDQKLIELDRRIQAAESELSHLPAKDDVLELKLALAELRGTVGRLDESLSGVSRTVHRVEDYLMKESSR
ncbi:hypothetical protein GCM10011316_29090 [Roseibium aquae]|uniref:DUF2730 family protein n=1 Tax=Roseibium aquae TaxID=1323746 RepID=A0A916X2J3_9HYPH|nr:DUF2730 family protein [Roseibium aquae]GGB55201.1 hypothetical protein GCM10011316_29090 [Roseibium aquae]